MKNAFQVVEIVTKVSRQTFVEDISAELEIFNNWITNS